MAPADTSFSSTVTGHHVLVFDSGLGGLSVAREIISAQPNCTLSYLADTAFFPYGTKPDNILIARIESLIGQAIRVLSPDIVVIACNTASTLALSHLRAQFSVPFVGVVPAIKPAAGLTKSKVFGVLATPATVARPYTAQLINDFARDCRVIRFGSHALVTQAEALLCGQPPTRASIEQELVGLFNQPQAEQIDTVVLACTHFPLLTDHLKQAAPQILHWVDSAAAVARQVGVLLKQLPQTRRVAEGVEFYSTQAYKNLHLLQVETLLSCPVKVDSGELFHDLITRAGHGQN